jgi:hypothetical protein
MYAKMEVCASAFIGADLEDIDGWRVIFFKNEGLRAELNVIRKFAAVLRVFGFVCPDERACSAEA